MIESLGRIAVSRADWSGFETILEALERAPRDAEHDHLAALAHRLVAQDRWLLLVDAALANRPLDAVLPRLLQRDPERLVQLLGGARGLQPPGRRVGLGDLQPEPGQHLAHPVHVGGVRPVGAGQFRQRGVESGPPPQDVDGLESTGRHQPGSGLGRDPVPRPLLDGRREGVLQRLLGEVEVAEEADQRGKDAPRFGAVDGVDRRARLLGRVHGHDWESPSAWGEPRSILTILF